MRGMWCRAAKIECHFLFYKLIIQGENGSIKNSAVKYEIVVYVSMRFRFLIQYL